MAKLTIQIGAKIGALKKGLANGSSAVQKWSRKVSGFTKAAFGAAFIGVGAGIGAIIRKSARLAAQFEQIKVAFTTMVGSADKAKGLIAELNEFSKATPFSPDQVFKAGKTLLAFGFESKNVSKTLKLLGDVSAGTGKDLGEMAVIFGQIKGAGRLMGQDLLQLINAGFNPLQVISKKTGKSMAQLKEEMSKGLITFDQVEGAFKDATSEGGLFFNMMEKQAQTLNGQLSTLDGNINDLIRQFGELTLPELKLVVSGLGEAVQGLQELAAARALIESGGVSSEAGVFEEVAANAAINGLEMAAKFFLPFDKLSAEAADKLREALLEAGTVGADAITAAEVKEGKKRHEEEKAAEKKEQDEKKEQEEKKVKPLEGLADSEFESADPFGDMVSEGMRNWNQMWEKHAKEGRAAEAEEAKKAQEKAQNEMREKMSDAFKPGGVVQSRLARIGGERTIAQDPSVMLLNKQLDVQQKNLQVNEKIAKTLADYGDPVFPGGR